MGRGSGNQQAAAGLSRKGLALAKRQQDFMEAEWSRHFDLCAERDIEPSTWLSSSEDITKPEGFRAILDGFHHEATGFTTVVHEYDPQSWETGENKPNPWMAIGDMHAHASIYDADGEYVGYLHGYLRRDANKRLEFRIGTTNIRREAAPENNWHEDKPNKPESDYSGLGKGFGRAFHTHIEDQLRKAGVDRMALHAVNLGAHVWASLGYEVDPRYYKESDFTEGQKNVTKSLIKRALFRIDNDSSLEKYRSAVESLTETSTLYEMSCIGKADSTEDFHGPQWFGKEIINGFHGVKFL